MKIIEKAIVGKKSQEACEDGLAINDSFVAVIDGSTSKTAVEISPGMSNGRYCMELIRRYIGIMPADISVDDFCANVTAVVRNEYMAHALSLDYLERHPVERLTASAVVYSCFHKQVWMVGDCQCIVGGTYYDNPKPQEAVLADKRAGYLKAAMKGGLKVGDVCTYDPGRRFIMHDLKECCMYQNIDYPVIDGFEIPTSKVKVINVNDDCGEIILASDGYPFLKPTLEDSEMALSRQLADDPLCIGTFKATKGLMDGNVSFDDRCYVRFTV